MIGGVLHSIQCGAVPMRASHYRCAQCLGVCIKKQCAIRKNRRSRILPRGWGRSSQAENNQICLPAPPSCRYTPWSGSYPAFAIGSNRGTWRLRVGPYFLMLRSPWWPEADRLLRWAAGYGFLSLSRDICVSARPSSQQTRSQRSVMASIM